MATPFDKIYDRALTVIQDYKLDNLAKLDYEAFLLRLQSILELAVPQFSKCLTSLEYDTTLLQFNETLDNDEINILAKIMVDGWFTGELQDTTVFTAKLSNREFKTFSEAQNLKERSEYLDRLREKYNQDMTNYQIKNLSKIPFFGGN